MVKIMKQTEQEQSKGCSKEIRKGYTVFFFNIETSSLLTILVLTFEQVHFTSCCHFNPWLAE